MPAKKNATDAIELSRKEIVLIDVSKLLLDEENPRLPESLKPRTQKAMIGYIASKSAVEDLMASIGRNGFFPGEALVAYRNPLDKQGCYRVIEGNRRLTAVKLILDTSLYPRASLVELASDAKNKDALSQLPVVLFNTREEVLPYLGSRHIVGVRQWEPLAKARYMRQLYSVAGGKNTSAKERYRNVAEQIGSHKRTDYIKSNLDGLAVYDLMDSKDFFKIEGLAEDSIDFGTLYTAVGYDSVAEYIGAAKKKQGSGEYERLEPISTPRILRVDRVKQLAEWLYKENVDGETTVGESRDLPKLAKILATAEARKELEDGASLEIAYGYTSGVTDDLLRYMQETRKLLRTANGVAPSSVPDATHLRLADDLVAQIESLRTAILNGIDKLKKRSK